MNKLTSQKKSDADILGLDVFSYNSENSMPREKWYFRAFNKINRKYTKILKNKCTH